MPPADRLAPGGGSAVAAVEPPFVFVYRYTVRE